MRPDLEDYEELQPTDEAPRSRAMSWLVLAIAVGGFAALAYYAYNSGQASVREGDMLVVQADGAPIAPIDAVEVLRHRPLAALHGRILHGAPEHLGARGPRAALTRRRVRQVTF